VPEKAGQICTTPNNNVSCYGRAPKRCFNYDGNNLNHHQLVKIAKINIPTPDNSSRRYQNETESEKKLTVTSAFFKIHSTTGSLDTFTRILRFNEYSHCLHRFSYLPIVVEHYANILLDSSNMPSNILGTFFCSLKIWPKFQKNRFKSLDY